MPREGEPASTLSQGRARIRSRQGRAPRLATRSTPNPSKAPSTSSLARVLDERSAYHAGLESPPVRRAAWVAGEVAVLVLTTAEVPPGVRLLAACLALAIPAYLIGRALVPDASLPLQALVACCSLIVIALGVNFGLQLWIGISRLPLAASLILLTAVGAVVRPQGARSEGAAVLVLIPFGILAAIVAAAIDPNRTQLVAYDAWFTFQSVREVFEFGGILSLSWYPRGVHYLFATPAVLVQDASLATMIATVLPYRAFNLFSLSLGAYCLARELDLKPRFALACAFSVYLFNPGGLPSSWHLMPRATGLVLIPATLILLLRMLRTPTWRVGVPLAVMLAASVYVHQFIAFQLALATVLAATLARPWLAVAGLAAVGLFAAVTFDPPRYFDLALQVPGLDVLFVGKYYPVDLVSYNPFSFYPILFSLGVALAALVVVIWGTRAERLVGLFALCMLLASANSFVSERWYASLHPIALAMGFAAARHVPHPRLRVASTTVAALLVASAVLTQTAYASWAQGSADPEDVALYEAAGAQPCHIQTDVFNGLQVLATAGAVQVVVGPWDPRIDPPETPACLVVTGRTTRAFYNESETISVLPQRFLAHPALVPFANQSAFERLHASAEGDHLLLRVDRSGNRTVPPTVLVLEDPVAESEGNDRSKWVAQVALFRLGIQFRTVNSTSLRDTSFEGIDTVLVPTNEILRRMQYEYPARTHLEDFLKGGGRLVAVGGSYGEFAPMLGVRAPIAFREHTSEIRWGTPNGSAVTSFEYEVEMHRYDLDPQATVLARDPDGFPIAWRVRVGNGTAVLSPFQHIGAGDDVFHFLKALWLFGHDRDEEALAAAVVPPPPGYTPWHEPSFAFYTSWRDLQAPYNVWLRPLLLWGALATVAAWAVRESALALRDWSRRTR